MQDGVYCLKYFYSEFLMKKFIPNLIAIILIKIVGAGVVGSQYVEKYSYSKETQDMEEYYHIESPDDVAIVLHDSRIDIRGKLLEGKVYPDFSSTVLISRLVFSSSSTIRILNKFFSLNINFHYS